MASRLARFFRGARPAASHEPPLEELKLAAPGLHRLFPDDAELLAALAMKLFTNGLPVRGRECLDEARTRGLSEQRAAAILARHHAVRREFGQALDALAGPLARDTPAAEVHELAGVIFFHAKDIARAHRHYREAVRLDPSNTMVRASFSGVLDHFGRFEEAIAEAIATLRYDPRSPTALENLSVAYGALGRFDDEKRTLELARAYHPQDAHLGLQHGFFKLRAGDYAGGWPLYEHRLDDRDQVKVRPSTAQRTRWRGEDFRGKTLLVFAEQGAGDNIMVARFFPELKARGGDVVLEIAAPLSGLLGRASGVDRVVALDALREPPLSYDLWIPSMSIPYVLGFDPARVEAPRRYLAPTAESTGYWRERIARYAGRKVGIAWSGSPVHRNDLSRSIPFELVRPLLTAAGTQFFSLQLAPGWGPQLPKPPTLIDLTEELFTFDDTAGLAECMDLIISVDTSVAHLAGALGKPTWVLVPHVAEWRWGLAGEASAWYPSVKILRQPRPRDWAGLLTDVGARLSAL